MSFELRQVNIRGLRMKLMMMNRRQRMIVWLVTLVRVEVVSSVFDCVIHNTARCI